MAKETIITVENLVKQYDKFTAVNGITFEVYENEIFGFLGPNGAGKTTTLEIIETLRDKTSGKIVVGGHDLDNDADAIKEIIGVQLQAGGFYPDLNLVEILNLFAAIYGVKINARELLAKVNLQDKAKAMVKNLSGGQKQRFSLATTIVHNPPVIFLDEPSTGLDPQSRRNLWELIKDIRAKGSTVVITTHFMDEAEILCDRVAIMNEGKIVKMDTPDKLIDELISKGFTKQRSRKIADLEDVFIDLTGKELRE
jgi:ABC-2 type transport system ATP-binding protein